MDPARIKDAFPGDSSAAQLDLAVPQLELDFRMSVALNPKISLGEGPWGQRNWISFTGGQWTASWGYGTVEPGGQDSQLVNPQSLHTFVETKYLLRTADQPPAYIAVQTTGWRTGPREVLEKLFDPQKADDVKASEYSFRLSIKLETGDERYKDQLNTGMWVASGARRGAEGKLEIHPSWFGSVAEISISCIRCVQSALRNVQGEVWSKWYSEQLWHVCSPEFGYMIGPEYM